MKMMMQFGTSLTFAVVVVNLLVRTSAKETDTSLFLRHDPEQRELQGAPDNDVCETAPFLDATEISAGLHLNGTTLLATEDTISCLGSRAAVYYKFRGTGARYIISTCDAATDFDSALFLFDGTCDNLGCAIEEDENDFDCVGTTADDQGLAATIEFYSEPDTIYTVAVAGRSPETTGNFGLSIQEFELPENDDCESSVRIYPSLDDSIMLTGSTVNATYNSFACESGEKLAVYYKFVGTGGLIHISTCNNQTNFKSSLALYDNDQCGGCPVLTNDLDFGCDDEGKGSTIDFMSLENTFYTIAVRGVSTTDAGEYGLTVQEFVRPSNDVCSAAERIEAVAPMSSQQGGIEDPVSVERQSTDLLDPMASNMTMLDSTTMMNYTTTVAFGSTSNSTVSAFSCLSGQFPSAFYSVIGTGQRMRVSTCTPEVELQFNSVIHIYTDRCDGSPSACSSEWTNDHDFDCEYSPDGYASTVEWETEPNRLYSIGIRGMTEEAKGDFGLSLEAYGNVTMEGSTCRWVQVCDAA